MTVKEITTQDQLKEAFSIREAVFVEEQQVPLADEFDAFDHIHDQCRHVLAYFEQQAVGTGRIRWVEGVGKLERICVLPHFRSLRLGQAIIHALEAIAREKGMTKVMLHGQTHAEKFYHKLGYQTTSEVFLEDGIPHVVMTKTLHHSP